MKSIIVGKSRQKGLGATGHTTPTIRKQRKINACSTCFVLFFFSFQCRTQVQEMMPSSSRVGLPTSLNLLKIIPHRLTQRGSSSGRFWSLGSWESALTVTASPRVSAHLPVPSQNIGDCLQFQTEQCSMLSILTSLIGASSLIASCDKCVS